MCNTNTLQKVLGIVTDKMKDLFAENLNSIILFGSYARGDYDDESDIDVFVMVDMDDESLRQYRREVLSFIFELDLEYGIVLTIKLQDKPTFDKWEHTLPFFMNVKREGVTLYAA